MNVNEKSCCIYKAEKKKSFLNSIFGKSKKSTEESRCVVVKSEESCSEGSKHLEDSKALQCCDLNDDVGTDKPCRQLDCRMEENDAVSFIELERASSEIELSLKSFTPCETCREYSGTWCSSAKRENCNKLSFSCLNYGTQIRRASLASLTHTAQKNT